MPKRRGNMCEFCSKHKRKKWFLDPENYHEMMLEDKHRQNILQKLGKGVDYYFHQLNTLTHPELRNLFKTEHAGQIITLNDALEMVDLAENHVLSPCICRALTANIKKNYCILLGPMKDLVNPWEEMEEVDNEELKLRLRDWRREGIYTLVGYAKPPYPTYICNCDRKYCFAAKTRVALGINEALLKGHEVARVDPKKCKCEKFQCIAKCPFGAMFVDRTNMRVVVDPTKCFGCGLCLTECSNNAIDLVNRENVPAAKGKW